MLPGLFTIAEIHIIEGRIKKAEEYLNAAHWSFLKNNDKQQSDKKKEKEQNLSPEYKRCYKGSKLTIKLIFIELLPSFMKLKMTIKRL